MLPRLPLSHIKGRNQFIRVDLKCLMGGKKTVDIHQPLIDFMGVSLKKIWYIYELLVEFNEYLKLWSNYYYFLMKNTFVLGLCEISPFENLITFMFYMEYV